MRLQPFSKSQLDVGNTGTDLSLTFLYYPYYAMLDEKGQHMYRQIYANANDVYSQFLPVEEMTAGQLRNIFSAVYNDHPELLDGYGICLPNTGGTGDVWRLT